MSTAVLTQGSTMRHTVVMTLTSTSSAGIALMEWMDAGFCCYFQGGRAGHDDQFGHSHWWQLCHQKHSRV